MRRLSGQAGFTLVEMAIVLLILGLLIGGLTMPLKAQRDNARVRASQQQLETVIDAVSGFAAVNGYLPCPATAASAGTAATGAGGCVVQHGFVPATTLDLQGVRNADNLLLDPWGSALRYSVSAADANADGRWDFTTAGEMSAVTMAALAPDLVVCSTSTGSTPAACGSANSTLADGVPAIVYSLGGDETTTTSPDQLENVGGNIGGGPSGRNYGIAADLVFVSRGRSERGGDEFDDQLGWLPGPSLYADMLAAGHLP